MIQEGDPKALDPLEILVEYAAARREKETGKRPGHFAFNLEDLKETIHGDTSLSPEERAQLLICISIMDQLDRDDDPEALLEQVHWILAKHHITCNKLDAAFLHSLMMVDENIIPSSETVRIINLLNRIEALHAGGSLNNADPVIPAP